MDLIIISLKINLLSQWYSWSIVELASNTNHWLTVIFEYANHYTTMGYFNRKKERWKDIVHYLFLHMINTKIRQILRKYQKISDENRWIEQNLPIYSIGCMNTDWAQYNSESMIGVWRQFNNASAILQYVFITTDVVCSNLDKMRCTTLCDKACQWVATGRWFSPGTSFPTPIKLSATI
jgi:hypothetical protein